MSVIGTGTAAAVAQTALQAQQVARRRDRAKTDSAGDAKRIRETIQQRPDDADAPADDAVDPPTGTPMDAPPPLYRHLDIQA